jgi:hypothetical protein
MGKTMKKLTYRLMIYVPYIITMILCVATDKNGGKLDKDGEPENFCHKGAATPENMGGDVEGGQQQLGLDVLV